MHIVTDEIFEDLINQSIGSLPKSHLKYLENVAILKQDLPTLEQREKNSLRDDQTLLGLYEGVPLSHRQGGTKILPDKITLFKIPLESISSNEEELKNNIRHTIWHEIAHYFGLNHEQIKALE
jgi:predicted Zn-dependent protease with MMP-like domain